MTIDKKKLKELKKAYDKTVGTSITEFEFEGGVILTSYAKYLIEYCEHELSIKQDS